MKKTLKGILPAIILSAAVSFPSCNDHILGDIVNDSTGYGESYSGEGISFTMIYVKGGKTFPSGVDNDDSSTAEAPYWIGESEVTYELWYAVRVWAENSGIDHDGDGLSGDDTYSFANNGTEGNDGTTGAAPTADFQQPVANINWRDCMIWCNALTEWCNSYCGTGYSCVYFSDSSCTAPIRTVDNTATNYPNPGGQDDPYVKDNAGGFRLLSNSEWEHAARYIDGSKWLLGDHASGDTTGACYDDGSILGSLPLSSVYGDYASYDGNSPSSSVAVKSKRKNHLGVYDMSGSMWEWCFDWEPGSEGVTRSRWGGSWYSTSEFLRVGYYMGSWPYSITHSIGLRLGRSHP